MLNVSHNPDVLSCLANLSSDEVFTPPKIANQVLNLLPKGIWQNPDATFLDPATKSGVFLREITKRLLVGLKSKISDKQERVNHILTKQVFGIGITELTTMLARRSLYCSKKANGEFSVVSTFDDEAGNIIFPNAAHTWASDKCVHCGASEASYSRDSELESHAYKFIHAINDFKGRTMKFDVIIGNPPYQLDDSGHGSSATPIYHKFVDQAISMSPSYLCMIIPSRWFAGGKGLDKFRKDMMGDRRISHLVDYPIASDIFPGVSVNGGICYFLWQAGYNGKCSFTSKLNGANTTLDRYLNQFDTLVRFNQAISILEKVSVKKHSSFSHRVSRQKPFGLRTFERPSGNGEITLYANKTIGKIESNKIINGLELIKKWKVLLSMGYGEGGEKKEYPRMIIGKPIVASPSSACTETYIVAGSFDNENEVLNCSHYLKTKFIRFLIALRKNTQHVTKDRFKFVPDLEMSKKWDDKKLYKYFSLSNVEINFIEQLISEMA